MTSTATRRRSFAAMPRASRWLVPVLTVVGVIMLAQLITSAGVFRPDQFPTPLATGQALLAAAATPTLWASVAATLQAWFWGLLIATTVALVGGALLASNDFALRSVSPIIEVFKAIPAIAILPLVILVLGSTLGMKVFLVAFGVVWPLLIQVIYGMRSMDATVRDTAKVLGVRGVRRFLQVTIPTAAPFVATGLRIASANALILSVVAELVGGANGIGRIILQAQSAGATAYPRMYAFVIVSGLLGLLLTGIFILLERRALHWHESQRNAQINEGATR